MPHLIGLCTVPPEIRRAFRPLGVSDPGLFNFHRETHHEYCKDNSHNNDINIRIITISSLIKLKQNVMKIIPKMNPNENDTKNYEVGVMMMIMALMLEITLIINSTTLHDAQDLTS